MAINFEFHHIRRGNYVSGNISCTPGALAVFKLETNFHRVEKYYDEDHDLSTPFDFSNHAMFQYEVRRAWRLPTDGHQYVYLRSLQPVHVLTNLGSFQGDVSR